MTQKTVIIVQARVASTRLPAKVLREVCGRPLILHELERLACVDNVDSLTVATTEDPSDDPLCDLLKEKGISYFRGSSDDVLHRFCTAAEFFEADVVVRCGGDCPLIDPAVVQSVIQYYLNHPEDYDYVSNTVERTYPRGMDTEIFSLAALQWADREANREPERHHVTPFFYLHPERFRLGHVTQPADLSHYRWTVDTPEDLDLVTQVLEKLGPENRDYTMKAVLALLHEYPSWMQINQHIEQQATGL